VIAWRVPPAPPPSRVMESGPPADSRPMSRSRVASASAANTGTASSTRTAAAPPLRDMTRDRLDLPAPPTLGHPERLGPAGGREPVEPRLDDPEVGALARFLEEE